MMSTEDQSICCLLLVASTSTPTVAFSSRRKRSFLPETYNLFCEISMKSCDASLCKYAPRIRCFVTVTFHRDRSEMYISTHFTLKP
ncbi:hypothetical protein B9Z55_010741 [Caenorhabditis nigoni]|uniref:Uncharacterized protein n=1 Tax=Caenorhabditis nigoni TaxID=1611254 RepID=A0A2G5UH45_9PELO|nr:hypothetical protein B9Z55_010741 [Caenorhabditis nigoni]